MRSRSNFFAVLLIVIGAIFLAINLGLLPAAEVKALLAKWWPVLLIALGVARLVTPRREH